MILYNILLGILAILSIALIALGILQGKDLCVEFFESPIIKGVLGIGAIISICLSKYFILDEISIVAVSNFLILFVAVLVFILYIACITHGSIEYEVPHAILMIMCPTLFFGVTYIFNYFAK